MTIAAFLSPVVSMANPLLWGFRCSSAETKTVTTVALKDGKVISITVHPEVDGQIHFARTATLHEIGPNRYSGEYAASQQDHDTDQSQQMPQTLNYEMSFELVADDSIPKIQQASLKENGIAPTNLNCSPVFQTRTKPAILL